MSSLARGDKKRASGHEADSSLNVYDHEIPIVPVEATEFQENFQEPRAPAPQGDAK